MKPILDRIQQQTTISDTGKIGILYVVTFHVGTHGPFTVQIPQNEFDAGHVQAAMNKVADTINNLALGA